MEFRKKPVVIEAFQWTGGPDQIEDPDWIVEALFRKKFNTDVGAAQFIEINGVTKIQIYTLEGNMVAEPNDWIIKGVKGEIYPCKPDIFEATYSPEDESKPKRPVRMTNVVEALERYMGKFGDCGDCYDQAKQALAEINEGDD